MMANLVSSIPDYLVKALGWTLIHSIWQGLFMLLLVKFMINIWHIKSSNARYWIGVIGLLSVFAWSVYTFDYYFVNPGANSPVPINIIWPNPATDLNHITLLENSHISSASDQLFVFVQDHLQFVVLPWLLGFLIFNMRIIGGYLYLHRLKAKYTSQLSDFWQNKFTKLKKRLDITKSIKVYESWKTSVPIAMGYLKPVILLPVGLVTNLSVQQVEAVLAHELAHIKRSDFLVNLIQQFLGAIYFFNPGFILLSALINRERENCCDDIVISYGSDKMAYARALASIQHYQLENPLLALSLASGKKHILYRIQRLFNQSIENTPKKEKIIPAIILLLSLTCVSWYSLTLKDKVKKQAVKEMAAIHLTPPAFLRSIPLGSDTLKTSAPKPTIDSLNIDVNVNANIEVDIPNKINVNIDTLRVDPKISPKTQYIYQFRSDSFDNRDSLESHRFSWSFDSNDLSVAVPGSDFGMIFPPPQGISEDFDFGIFLPSDSSDDSNVIWKFIPDPKSFQEGDFKLFNGKTWDSGDVQKAMRDYLDKSHDWRQKMDSLRQEAMKQLEKSHEFRALQEQILQEKMHAEQDKMRAEMDSIRTESWKKQEKLMENLQTQNQALILRHWDNKTNFDSEIEVHKKALEKHEEELKSLEEFRKSLTKELKKDGYLGKNEELKNLTVNHDQIMVNGQKIKYKDEQKYRDLINKQKK